MLTAWPALLMAQTFTQATGAMGVSNNSGGCVGVTDMNNDGFDDIVVLHNSRVLRIFYQMPNGWAAVDYGQISGNNQWGMAIGDISGSGHKDVIAGGSYDGVHHIKINSIGDFEDVDLANGSMFMQACNVVDIDNDGHLDYFACHDDGLSRIWTNDGSGNLVPNASLIDLTNYDTGDFPDTDHSGNYGSVWSDIDDNGTLDLVIAKCRQFVNDPYDPRRINQAWMNDGNGNWTEDALDRGMVLYEQSWTVDFGDVNNDGFFDCLLTNHSTTLKLLLNDGTGHFTDVTVAAGLDIDGFFLQAKMADFDNDGYLDVLYAGGAHSYFRNNGDGSFTQVNNMFPNNDLMHSFGIGDLNKDGFLDVYASYGDVYVDSDAQNPDILWMNNANANNWIAFDLEATDSNIDAVGAKIKIYGDFGVQVREVRAGESYGIVNSFHLNFGLGQATEVDMVEIYWPAGGFTSIINPEINTYHQIVEGDCVIAPFAITSSVTNVLCPGETATITAPSGFTYLWSNGATTPSIEVDETGFYSVIITDGQGCSAGSNAVGISIFQPEPAEITVNGELSLCEGSAVELIASQGESYTWSTNATEQSITVSEPGEYSVVILDQCGDEWESMSVNVVVYEAPEAPTTPVNWTINAEGGITETLPGNQIEWYALESEGAEEVLIATGNSIDLSGPEILSLAGFLPQFICARDVIEHDSPNVGGGKETNTQEGGQFQMNSNFWPVFDAHTDIVIETVKVYAGQNGPRTIALVNANGQTLQQATINIPEGEQIVELNFEVPQGENYGLRCTDASPQLWRDGPPAVIGYPFAIGDLATITTSSVSGANALNFYYFFYDWQVSIPTVECESVLACAAAAIVSVDEATAPSIASLYPNPARDYAYLQTNNFIGQNIVLSVLDAVGRTVAQRNVTISGNADRITLDVTALAPGMYLVNLRDGDRMATARLLVE
ncbi:MAG: FG-GAP-like repeat-containing protein [Flavobacteriales bacterium]